MRRAGGRGAKQANFTAGLAKRHWDHSDSSSHANAGYKRDVQVPDVGLLPSRLPGALNMVSTVLIKMSECC